MSPFLISRPSMTMPSVEVMPTRRPISLRMWAIIRTVVVLPFVPVTAMIGMRAASRAGTAVDDRLGDVLRLALGRVGVHPEAGRRVDLDDRAAGLADGRRDVRADEVDAGDVEADDPGRRLGDLDVVGVGLDRPVDRRAAGRHVAGQGELDPGARRRARRRARSPAPRTSSSAASSTLIRVRTFSWPMPRRGSGVRDVDELADRVLAVAGDRRRDALGDRRDLAADHEAAVVVAGDVGLDDDVARAALARARRGTRPGPPPRSAGRGGRRGRGCRRAA